MEGMERWQGKVAVVTGASVGIGLALCQDLVKAGMIVCGMSKRKDKMEAIRRTLFDDEQQLRLNCIEADIRDKNQVAAAFRWIEEVYGGIDLLINNAGVITKGLLLDEKNTYELYRTMETNILGLLIVTKEAVQYMRKREEDVDKWSIGHIVNINSIFGHKIHAAVPKTKPINGLYPASKFAVTHLTDYIRQELKYLNTRIKISSISPGLVDSDIATTGTSHSLIKCMPKLKPSDVSQAVMYAISVPDHVLVHEIIIKPVGEFL
jgi:NADP+-dependent farnesol dehydrogenase